MKDERHILSDIERDERWLAGYAAPAVPDANIESVRLAVRRELSQRQRAARSLEWKPALAFAAAASIVLAVWFGRSSPEMGPSVAGPHSLIVAAAGSRAQEDAGDVASIAEMNQRLDELETWSKDSTWDLDGTALTEAVSAAYRDDGAGQPG